MFEPNSRYNKCEDAEFVIKNKNKNNNNANKNNRSVLPTNQTIKYKKRRFLPQGSKMPLLQEITTKSEDRLDIVSYNFFGDPEQFWRICDANDAMHPLELTSEPDRILRVALPWNGEGHIDSSNNSNNNSSIGSPSLTVI